MLVVEVSATPLHFCPLPWLWLPEVPRWATCRLLEVLVNNASCGPDCGSASVALACSCALTARFEDGEGFCLLLTLAALTPSFRMFLPLSSSKKSSTPSLSPSLSLPSFFELFSPLLPNLHVSQLPLSCSFPMGNKRAAQRCSRGEDEGPGSASWMGCGICRFSRVM